MSHESILFETLRQKHEAQNSPNTDNRSNERGGEFNTSEYCVTKASTLDRTILRHYKSLHYRYDDLKHTGSNCCCHGQHPKFTFKLTRRRDAQFRADDAAYHVCTRCGVVGGGTCCYLCARVPRTRRDCLVQNSRKGS